VTVLESIQKSADFLTRKGVDSPRLQAELLLAHILKTERMRLYLNFDRVLSDEEINSFRDLVVRRSNREPLQYIVGSTSFCGIEIAVNRDVLIPRPETELLAEKAWQALNSKLQTPNSSQIRALDLCTGSGCLAIALAKNCPQAHIVAIDFSSEALECAKANATKNNVGAIQLRLGDGFDALASGERFDLIVSNPPYIPTAEIDSLQPEVKDWEPGTALDGGPDGLDWYRKIAARAAVFLAANAKLMLEIGDGQAESVRNIFQEQNWIVEQIVDDYIGRPRVVVARRHAPPC
jgi:release factor glutamine methyltransferase